MQIMDKRSQTIKCVTQFVMIHAGFNEQNRIFDNKNVKVLLQ